MDRLLSGKPRLTDGRLTLANVAREAEVGLSTVKRMPDLVAAFRERSGRELVDRSTEADLLAHSQLREARDEISALNREIKEMSHQIYGLQLENERLRTEMSRSESRLVDISSRRSRKAPDR